MKRSGWMVAGMGVGLIAGLGSVRAWGQEATTVLVDVDHRSSLSLDGAWHVIADPYMNGMSFNHGVMNPHGYFEDRELAPGSNGLIEYDFAKSPMLRVPGDWNTQREDLMRYEGPMWYERHFDYTPEAGHRAYLHIGAANYRSRAFVNGTQVCEHEGGFTPFDCEMTKVVKAGANSVVILVDSTRLADGVPTLKVDWYNYGGLTRDVSVVTVPERFVDDYELHLDRPTRSVIEGYVHVEGATGPTPVTVTIAELGAKAEVMTDGSGRAAVKMPVKGLVAWSPETPKLYKVEVRTGAGSGADAIEDEMGFRTVEVSGTKILLNGKPIMLRGVTIHAEAPFRSGRAYSDADVSTLLGWVKELGANYVRLAHYPHDERMTRAADRMGILVWSEVPVYWAVEFEKEAVFAKSQAQLHDEIRRDRDKASVILWSIANETPNTPARTAFLTRSAAYVRSQDPERLVTAALLVRGNVEKKTIDDPLGAALDVIGFNEYIGWYEGTPEDAAKTVWETRYQKPLIVSEFGGGAKAGLHGPETKRWTEEFQARIYRNQIVMLNKIPQLRGMSPWVLMDFRSPTRQLPGIQDGFNRKGLISDQGQKKEAFGVLEKAYKAGAVGKAE